MKKYLIWACAALTAMVCMTACDETTYVSYPDSDFPEYLTESSLPDSCKMEVVKVRYDYYACIENAWVEITDSATIKEFQENPDKAKIKEKLKEIESQLKQSSSSKKVSSSSSSKKTKEDVESSDSEERGEEYNEEDDVCTGRHCDDGNSSSSKKKSNSSDSSSSEEGGEGGEGDSSDSSSSEEGGEGGEGDSSDSSSSEEGGEGGEGDSSDSGEEDSSSSGSEPEVDCSEQVFDPNDYFCDNRDGHVYKMVTVDNQIWMAENLAYKTPNAKYFGEEVREGEGYLQDNHPEWGYYYSYDEATTSACPTGWHLPSNTEWENAVNNYESVGIAIGALEILPSGYYESSWYDDGYPSFWSSGPATSPYFSVYDEFFNSTYSPSDELAMNSIRCVQD
jgi:hypothetical protein